MSRGTQDGVATSTTAKVSLGFAGENVVPREVTQMMGLEPSSAHAKGELTPRTKTAYVRGTWALEFESDDVEQAAGQLLAALGGKRDAMAEVVTRMSACVNVAIWWEPEGAQGGYTVSSETLRELASLGERIDFYFA